jgi:hypothetical protein
MDFWRTKDGRLFARFWSRSEEVDWYSYEVIGRSSTVSSVGSEAGDFGEALVPECLRDEYDNWLVSEMPFVFPYYMVTLRT